MSRARRTVALIGCPELVEPVRALHWRARVVDYYWGTGEAEQDWACAVVDASVAGGTGLSVAERLLRRSIATVVLYRPGERDRVLPRFVGVARVGSRTAGLGHALSTLR